MRSDRFRAAAEGKDFSALDEIFTEDVSFRSPVVFKQYEGREAVAMLLAMVAHVFEDFRYTDQIETGDTAALAFEARVGDRELEGIDLLALRRRRQGARDGGLHAPPQRRQSPRQGDAAQARRAGGSACLTLARRTLQNRMGRPGPVVPSSSSAAASTPGRPRSRLPDSRFSSGVLEGLQYRRFGCGCRGNDRGSQAGDEVPQDGFSAAFAGGDKQGRGA